MKTLDVLARLLAFLRPFLNWVAVSVLLGAATVASGIALLGTSAYLIALAALQPSVAVLQVAIVGVRFFGISRGVFRYLERLVSHAVNFRLLAGLRVWFYRRIEPLVPARLQQERSADLLNRAIADIETLENFYVRAVAPPVMALVVTLGVGWFVGRYDPRLTLLLAAALVLSGAGLPLLAYGLSRRPGRAVIDSRARLNAVLLDAVQGLPDLLAYGQGQAQIDQIHASGAALGRAQAALARSGALVNGLGVLVTGITLAAALVISIPRVGVDGGGLDGISLAVVALITLSAFEAVNPLTQAAQHLESSLHAARRLFELGGPQDEHVAHAGEADEGQDAAAEKTRREGGGDAGGAELVIRGLTFAYEEGGAPALVDFSLDLQAGKHAALVGPSGAGKTTLFNLLLRFWDFQQGQVWLDGRDIRGCRPRDARRKMALIEPEAYLFDGTLRQNLLLARPDASLDDLERVIEAAQLAGWVKALPQGLDTWLGERGLQLSGGERQRVAVARALLQDARLLLMDEPTANLDANSERRLIEALRRASAGRSLILIAHRLVGLETMDEILVLDKGRVVERGTHEQLLAQHGLYARMYRMQCEALD